MMSAAPTLSYAQRRGYQAVRLPYVNSSTDMPIILPDEGRFTAVERRLSPDFIANLRMEQEKIDFRMPRWDFETEADLVEIFISLGLEAPFSGEADLSGIAPGLFVGDAVHKANITVDERGTEAIAATGAVGILSKPSTEIVVNRPFFSLYRSATRAPSCLWDAS